MTARPDNIEHLRRSPPAKTPCLEVKDFVRRYADGVSVGPINFDVQEGEFFSLLGPSGCGKTTTLRAIAGFERVDSGEIRLRGQPIQDVPANRRGIGLVFQRHALFPHLRVHDNVAFGLRQKKTPDRDVRTRVAAALELVGLASLANRMPSQLSGGQQQRVALARSLVLEPPLLLLDEPLSSLDLKLRVQMREEIRSIQKRLHKTTIFVTHDQNEALAMSDRIAVLSNGRIEQIGTPREIYNSPKTAFVAGFIGSTNQLSLDHIENIDGARVAVTTEGMRLKLDPRAPDKVIPRLFVRPERVRFTTREDSSPNVYPAQVISEEYLGEDVVYTVRTACGANLTVKVRVKGDANDMTSMSGPCFVAIDPEAVYVVD